jgi:CDP-diacylglycerol--glycerol-3-phosphate 3-phosphatidyltransferase
VRRKRIEQVSSDVHGLTNQEKATGSAVRDVVPVAVLYALVTVLLGVLLSRLWQPVFVLRWMVLSTVTLVLILWRLFQSLPENYHPSTRVIYHSLGLANHASLLRGVLLAWLGGFLLSPWPSGWLGWVPAALYTGAILLDGLDGLLARLTRRVSKLGQRLDIELDGLGILVGSALGMWWGQLPPWYALVALAYPAFTFGQWLRRKRGLEVYPLPHSFIRRPMAGIQMGFISAILWPILPPTVILVAATVVMVPFLASFMRDWLVVSGQLDAESPSYKIWARRLTILVGHWLPVLARLTVVVVFVLTLLQTRQLALFERQLLLGVVWLTVLGMLVSVGIMGRIAGALLAISVSLAMTRWGPTPSGLILLSSGLLLLQLGSGVLSVWQPEEIFLRMRTERQN